MQILTAAAEKDSANADWQRDLAKAHNGLGNVYVAKGALADALKEYQASLAITARLDGTDPTNIIPDAHFRVGSALRQQRKFAEALKEFQAELASAEQLAAEDPSNATGRIESRSATAGSA